MKWGYSNTHKTVFYEETNTEHMMFCCFEGLVIKLAPGMPFCHLKKMYHEKDEKIIFFRSVPQFPPQRGPWICLQCLESSDAFPNLRFDY